MKHTEMEERHAHLETPQHEARGEHSENRHERSEQERPEIKKKSKSGGIIATVAAVVLLAGAAFGIYVYDARHGEIQLNGDASITLEYGESFNDPGAEAFATGKLIKAREELPVSVSGEVDMSTLGTTELTYSAEYWNKTCTVSRTVTVVDTHAPVIELTNKPGKNDFTAEDNYDGDVSKNVKRTEAEGKILYEVTDSSGNTAKAERITTPSLTLTGGNETQVTADYKFFDPGYTAEDCYGRDITADVAVEGLDTITPWKPGSYELKYTVTDEFGNTAEQTRKVEVIKAELPETVVEEKVVYLTFDDGPCPNTEELLDILKEYDAKATFFVTGWCPNNEDSIGRAYREGHTIGVHGYLHAASQIYTSEQAYFDNFAKTQEMIYEQTGEYTRIVRFPGGSSNTSSIYFADKIMTTLAEDLTNMGYRYYDWNIQPENEECDSYKSYTNIIGNIPYCETPIVLQHDTAGYNLSAVRRVLEWGKENGYTFKAIDLTTPEVHHRIRN